ncbi:hypothetical protein EDB89DRAFT_640628 [Lactarius sanguifluus]|nr:hypothetical protein EDB89DRAFT_640628 [Lactarius sanguifluus]
MDRRKSLNGGPICVFAIRVVDRFGLRPRPLGRPKGQDSFFSPLLSSVALPHRPVASIASSTSRSVYIQRIFFRMSSGDSPALDQTIGPLFGVCWELLPLSLRVFESRCAAVSGPLTLLRHLTDIRSASEKLLELCASVRRWRRRIRVLGRSLFLLVSCYKPIHKSYSPLFRRTPSNLPRNLFLILSEGVVFFTSSSPSIPHQVCRF